MRMGRRRPLMRAAMVGGVAYHAGKKVQQGREQDADTQARLDDLESQQYQQQQQPQYAPPPPGPPAPAPNQGISPEAMEQLKQLADLKTQGILTDEEFDAQKKKILGL
jgi:Short C-terminal domain